MKKLIALFPCLFFLILVKGQHIEVPQTQKSMITKLTATWCPICGGTAWDTYSNLVQNLGGSAAVVMAAHYDGGSKLWSKAAMDLLDNNEGSPFGQPVFYFNRKKVGNGGANTENQINDMVMAAQGTSPVAQTGLRLVYDRVKRELTIDTRTQFFQAASGNYYLSILQVEREVMETQAARNGMQIHKRVIRQAVTAQTLGDELAVGNIAAGASYELNARMSFDSQADAEEYEFVTILWKKNGEVYEFVNTNSSAEILDSTTPVPAIQSQPVSIQIQPNPVVGATQVTIRSARNLTNAQLSLFHSSGQLIQTWRVGSWVGEVFSLGLDRTLLSQSGVYWVQLKDETAAWSEKIVVQ